MSLFVSDLGERGRLYMSSNSLDVIMVGSELVQDSEPIELMLKRALYFYTKNDQVLPRVPGPSNNAPEKDAK